MLLHLVMKVGKLLQPTVVYIGNAEKTFIKKVPKNDMSDPKRLKKELPKIIKKMSAEDRIMFIGTSLTPWDILFMLKRAKCLIRDKYRYFSARLLQLLW